MLPTNDSVAPPLPDGQGEDVVFRDVHKAFGETRALDGCSFRVRRGEIHAIVGENGSGKSTLVKILSGVLLPDRGEVSLLGQTPRSPLEARRLGLATIFQEVLVADEASVVDNMFAGPRRPGRALSANQKRALARETLERLALVDVDPETLVSTLPLNLRQWIVIARAILTEPRVLVLDESSAALDLDATKRLHAEMRRLRDGGSSIVIVTHRIAELVQITDRATVLRDGAVVGELAKAEINERNLMALMTPERRAVVAAPERQGVGGVPSDQRPLVDVKGLVVQKDAPAFDFSLRAGEIVGVAGLDGQGQDNFARVLAGIGVVFAGRVDAVSPTGGAETVRDLAAAERQGVVYVSGDRKREGIFPNLSIRENFEAAIYRRHASRAGWLRRPPLDAAFRTEVARFSIKMGAPSDRITSLSGGNQQKVLIGRAFSQAPRVIVLNDPARGVDLATKRELYAEIARFTAAGGAVVYLSSEIEEFLGFADRVAVFFGGTLLRTLRGEEVTEHGMLNAMFGQDPQLDVTKELAR